jgi:hypothetical protein
MMPTAWLQHQRDLAMAAFVAGLSIADFWAAMTLNMLDAGVPRPVLRLVAWHGHTIDSEGFQND